MQAVSLTVFCVLVVLGLALADYDSFGYGSAGYGSAGYGYGYAPVMHKGNSGGLGGFEGLLMLLLFLTLFSSTGLFNFTSGSSSPSVTVVNA